MHGGNFPGSFLINIGFNKHIGWGATVNRPDVMDIFKLTINPNNPNEYLKDGVWIPFKIEEDHLKFKLLGLIELKSDIAKNFICPLTKINSTTILSAKNVKRREEEEYYIQIRALTGKILPTQRVELVLYRHDVLSIRLFACLKGHVALLYPPRFSKPRFASSLVLP